MTQVNAPWSTQEVASLNAFQQSEKYHPFTGNRKNNGEETILIATPEGWIEYFGGPVIQTWAHDFMISYQENHQACPGGRIDD